MIVLKIKKAIPVFVAIFIMIGIISISSSIKGNTPVMNTKSYDKSDKTQAALSSSDTAELYDEMRGVWISYMELTMENEHDKSETAFKKKFSSIALKCKDFGFNTLIVQVRPFCDALYDSKYYPYSHILTGVQGKDPGFDPLKIMCRICRENNLYIHAWVNPYRISSNNTPNTLSNDNPYSINKKIGLKTDSGIYLDPSSKDVRTLIVDGIKEIAEKYDVDGIQFDDYFYPTQNENFDSIQYQNYIESVGEDNCMNLDNWRKANVNMLISETYRAIHKTSNEIIFGISPQGNINNNENLYADVKSWCTCKGFIDYICPQIYFSLDNPALTFEDSLKSWSELEYADNVKLYIGLAGYKAGTDEDDNTWLERSDILSNEYKIIQSNDKVHGFILYSFASLNDEKANEELSNLKNILN